MLRSPARSTPDGGVRRRPLRLLAALPAVALALAGCGGAEDATADDDARPWNDADVAFATRMIPHHAQALSLVDLTVRRDVDPALAELAAQVRETRAPEIEVLADWLQDWGEEIPPTMRDHVHAGHDMEDGAAGHMPGSTGAGDLPGMAAPSELDALADLRGEAFEDRWLELMIDHHEGAIEIARTEQEHGELPAVVELAEAIEDSQAAGIERMERLRSR